MIKNLIQERAGILHAIKLNRTYIREKVKKNQTLRGRYADIQDEIFKEVSSRMESGETLYEICMKEFGKIDANFHILYSLFAP